LAAHAAECRIMLLILVVHIGALDELEEVLNKYEEEELSSSSHSIVVVSILLSKGSSIVSKL
jgi:hypothetical protein